VNWLLPAILSSLLIVYNDQDPDSRSLAEYYAGKRGVPTNQLCRISVRAAETITRQEFNEQICAPLRDRLDGITTILLMRGVPLRIEHDPALGAVSTNQQEAARQRTEASVDSELALLPLGEWPLPGPLRNPWFYGGASGNVLPVGRLDGPDPATVRRMIDDALFAEKYGLHGRAYFDARGTREPGLREGDNWIRESYRFFREAGYECELDEQPAVFDEDYPMTDVAIYAGWYAPQATGPFQRSTFRFQPGAVAYHIHSFSAASVRSKTSYWVGPLLDKGAAATMGCVFEPYLAMTPVVPLFFRRLLDGRGFLEAGDYSQPVVSWQTTFVGDPRYRPFAVSLDEQIRRLEAAGRPEVEWAWLRKVNLGGGEKLCREKAAALQSPVLYEKLGDLTGDAAAYRQALQPAGDPYRYLRVASKLAAVYERRGQPREALALYEGLTAAFATRKNAPALNRKARELAVAAGATDKAALFQARLDEWERNKNENRNSEGNSRR